MRTLCTEICRLPGRIRLLLARRKDRNGVYLGQLIERDSSGHLVFSKSAISRIEKRLALTYLYLWESNADWMLVYPGREIESECCTDRVGTGECVGHGDSCGCPHCKI